MSKNVTKTVASLVALACLFAPAVERVRARQEAAAAEWARYTYPREEFSAMFPSAPFVWEIKWALPGSIYQTETGRVFGAYSDGVVYTVNSYDNPRPSEKLDYFAREFLLRYRKEMKLREGATVPFGGREYSHSTPCGGGGAQATCEEVSRVFRTDGHAYIVSAIGEPGHEAAVRKFLDSFTLSSRPEGKSVSEQATAPGEYRTQPKDEPKPEATPRPTPAPTPTETGGMLVPRQAGDEPNRPMTTREVTRKAIIAFKPEPGYTEKARKNDVTGVVRIKMVLGANGRVSNIIVVTTLPDGLTERAVLAARHMLFVPAMYDGRRVSQWLTVEYHFNIY